MNEKVKAAQAKINQAEIILNTLPKVDICRTLSFAQSALGNQAEQVKIALSAVSERVSSILFNTQQLRVLSHLNQLALELTESLEALHAYKKSQSTVGFVSRIVITKPPHSSSDEGEPEEIG